MNFLIYRNIYSGLIYRNIDENLSTIFVIDYLDFITWILVEQKIGARNEVIAILFVAL